MYCNAAHNAQTELLFKNSKILTLPFLIIHFKSLFMFDFSNHNINIFILEHVGIYYELRDLDNARQLHT